MMEDIKIMEASMKKVVVLGTGTMAIGIAAGFISSGYGVILLGRNVERAKAVVSEVMDLAKGLGSGSGSTDISNQQMQTGVIDDWSDWADVALVLETVTENLALKQTIFASLDKRVPAHIPIGSNSSGFPISQICQSLKTAERMFNMHYFMPAHIVPLVEVVLGKASDPTIAKKVCELFEETGKKPVLVNQDIPGFLANRIQHALMREALALVNDGIATPEDVDTAVRYSFGFRYAAVGPMTQKEISGWEGMAIAAKEIYPSLANNTEISPCLNKILKEKKFGIKSKEGFRTWSDEEAADMKRKYEKRLKAAFDVLQIEPD
jgi:3-hydroxybutyryl-CoA dehydrogenase